MWEMAHSISKGNEFGDIGVTPKDKPHLNFGTDCANPYALLAFLELNRATCKKGFLEMAKRIGDNILGSRFYKGFFVASKNHIYTKFDAVDPLVLLQLYSVLTEEHKIVPQVWPSMPYFICPYRKKLRAIDNTAIYALTESTEPPISLDEAATMGNAELVKSLIARGADVNGRKNGLFRTPLHYAADKCRKDITEILITSSAYVNARDVNGKTPLHYAVEKGHTGIAVLLIGAGADVNAENNNGQTLVDIARSRNRKETMELLIANGADVSLHTASRVGVLAKVESLIEEGACINARDASGQTPLHHAAERGHKDVVELLIANGADVNAKDNDGNTPGHVALDNNNRSILELLIAEGANFTSIHLSAYQGSLDEVRSFIDKGVNVNAKSKSGETPLHKAAIGGHKDIVKLLIDNAADINATEQRNYTPVHYAVWSYNIETVELLIEKGADVNAKDRWGWTPLHYMAKDDNIGMTQLLITKGADVNARDNSGETALSVAKGKGYTKMVELLRKHGAKER